MKCTYKELCSKDLRGVKSITIQDALHEFPQELFGASESLEFLDLSGNELETLPDMSRFKKLKIAFFSQNRFTSIPDVFRSCGELYLLGFRSNKIAHIEENVLPLNISWLILTDNALEKLPDSMGKLSKLQKFGVAGNKLTTLPQSMSQCHNLELLRLSANRVEVLPSWLFHLPKLAWLAFSGNPCAPSKESRLPVVALQDLELDVLLGEGASGKIYRAHSPLFKHLLAVKLFKGAITSDGYAQDEMNACMAVGVHPHLIKVLAKLEQGHLGLVLEHIAPSYRSLGNPPNLETCTRDTFVEGFHLEVQQVAKIAQGVASAAAHLHSMGIMHGDLYAHNILYNEEAHAYLGDFGAASFYDKEQKHYEKLDVLAFGNLLEDMLIHTKKEKTPLYEKLLTLQKRAQSTKPQERPSFCEMEFSCES